jgi:hypothetical protein
MYRIALIVFALVITGCTENLASSAFDTGMEQTMRAPSPTANPMPSSLEVTDESVSGEGNDSEAFASDMEGDWGCRCPIPDDHEAVSDLCQYCTFLNCESTECSYRPEGGGGKIQTVNCKW